MKKQFSLLAAGIMLLAGLTFSSCEKDEHMPPDLTFNTAAGYTSTDVTVGLSAAVLFGVQVEKTEDELKTFDVSVSLDGGTAASITGYPETISGSEEEGFNRDVAITTRNQAGTETYTFTVTDRDGNITQESITLTVQ